MKAERAALGKAVGKLLNGKLAAAWNSWTEMVEQAKA